MSEDKQKDIFMINLNKLLKDSGKTQKEVADAIGVSPQTFNTWMVGVALPRMGKVQRLADYFGIKKSELIEEKEPEEYYLNPETRRLAQELYDNPERKILFDATRDLQPEDIEAVLQIIERMKR